MDIGVVRLSCLPVGRCGRVVFLEAQGISRRRLLDLGFVPGTLVKAVRRSPAGDPTAYSVRGALIALRGDTARQILVTPESVGEEKRDQGGVYKPGLHRRLQKKA